eukprot:CAMPEP_0113642304 /NCGR_PEP_ID=MMETSP0017_2-20120614/22222_1 /TAXON_ID=2856 /ORGANISM="Cylindrotheca closterium" /LENGTH=365 /DNA_ID=CAMNT_0000553717 /DNA_START=18 /DNA_END=1115 /DNA_ORIENTATION=- /assembly_acc=CAM_ASM_000147
MEEERPKLRSVAIGAPTTSLPPLSRSFAMPSKLPSRPLHVQAAPKQPITASVQWTVDSMLPAISADYMLERTNVYINNSSAQQVADRITECLSCQSLSYKESDEENKKNSLLGERHCGLRFYLNLFADAQDPSTIILEVQRLTGCAFAFKQVCREVCRSAKGLSAAAPPTMKRKFPMPCGLPRASLAEKAMRFEGEVARALEMISSPMLDSQLLGMELLEGVSKSPIAAPLILKEDCICKLKDLIASREGDDEVISVPETKRLSLKKRQALTIIANALAHSESVSEELGLHSEAFVEDVFQCLKQSEDPHCASQAARCLHSLAASSPATKAFVFGTLQLPQVLDNLETRHHSLLQQECTKLQSVC